MLSFTAPVSEVPAIELKGWHEVATVEIELTTENLQALLGRLLDRSNRRPDRPPSRLRKRWWDKAPHKSVGFLFTGVQP